MARSMTITMTLVLMMSVAGGIEDTVTASFGKLISAVVGGLATLALLLAVGTAASFAQVVAGRVSDIMAVTIATFGTAVVAFIGAAHILTGRMSDIVVMVLSLIAFGLFGLVALLMLINLIKRMSGGLSTSIEIHRSTLWNYATSGLLLGSLAFLIWYCWLGGYSPPG